MTERKPYGYWTKERCQEEVLKYQTKTDLKKNCEYVYKIILKNGWFEELCSHITQYIKPNGYWTKEQCQEESLKYTSRIEFKYNSRAYSASVRNGWIDEVCTHMQPKQSEFNKINLYSIYLFTFPDNYFYVGLSNNIRRRKRFHLSGSNEKSRESQVWKHLQETKLIPKFKILEENISNIEAIEKENFYVNFYENSGLIKLNVAKPGSIGSNVRRWTYDDIFEAAKKFTYRNEFEKANRKAYQAACKYGIIDDVCVHMTILHDNWTNQKLFKLAKQFKSRSEFQKINAGAYKSAIKRDILDEICTHMIPLTEKWPKKRCQEEALKYTRKTDFIKNSYKAYQAAKWNGWYKEISSHMTEGNKPNGYWTKEKCREESLRCKGRKDFSKNNCSAYKLSSKNGWLDEFFPKTK